MSYLPTWYQCDYKHRHAIELTSLERFVFEWTPAGIEGEKAFRADLLAALSGVFRNDAWYGEQLNGDDPAYVESPTVYGDLTPAQISEYQDYEERKNRGN